MWSLKIVKGAELADPLVAEMRLPQPLQCFTIGRDPSNLWPIADRTLALSGRHCEIVASAAGPVLRDLSTNGTFVNGAKVRMAGDLALRDGDRIEIGPFVIAVSGPPMPARQAAAAPPGPAAPPARRAGVFDTAPHRGGDPAAMGAAGVGGAPEGLTEILRVARLSDDGGGDLTKIRLAPPGGGSAAARPAPAPAATAGAVSASSLSAALARGLNLPPSALAGHEPLLLAEQLAATARAAVAALRLLADAQASAQRAGAQAPRTADPLLTAVSAEAAVLALATAPEGPAAALQRSGPRPS